MSVPTTDFATPRDSHLFGPGPKRMLALDGGGVRGAISIGFIEEIEALLRKHKAPNATLGGWFDLIGGTSTGSIIAASLALNLTADLVAEFYHDRAPHVFRTSLRRIPGLRPRFDARVLAAEIERVVGERTLDTLDLITGFALTAKRVDTASPWIVANNPRGPYWDTAEGMPRLANRRLRLSSLIRASTAAPFYFDPEAIELFEREHAAGGGDPRELSGLFVDGGVSPYNNPSFILFLMATLRSYGISWATGPEHLTIVSIGTGSFRRTLHQSELGLMQPLRLAHHAIISMMDDAQTNVLATMQWLGRSLVPWPINRELGDLSDAFPWGRPLFDFVRYDVLLEPDWLRENLDVDLPAAQVLALREIDNPTIIPLAHEIGRKAAKRQVKPEHFGLKV